MAYIFPHTYNKNEEKAKNDPCHEDHPYVILQKEHVPFLMQLMTMQDFTYDGMLLFMDTPGKSMERGNQEKWFCAQYAEAMKWMMEALDEQGIPNRLYYAKQKKRLDNGTQVESFLDCGFYLKFQGMTWCPHYGFMAKEKIFHNPSEHSLNIEYLPIEWSELYQRLGGPTIEKDDYETCKEEVIHFFNNFLHTPTIDQNLKPALFVYKEGQEVWSVPVQVPKNTPLFNSENVKHQESVLLPLEEPRDGNWLKRRFQFIKTHVNLDTVMADKINANQRKCLLDLMEWSKSYENAWKDLACSETKEGQSLYFVKGRQKESAPNPVIHLTLDLNNPKIAEKLIRFLSLKQAYSTLSERRHFDVSWIVEEDFKEATQFFIFHESIPVHHGLPHSLLSLSIWNKGDTLTFFSEFEINKKIKEFFCKFNHNVELDKNLIPSVDSCHRVSLSHRF